VANSGDDLEGDLPSPWERDQSSGRGVEEIARFRAAFERHYEAVLAYSLRRLATLEDAEEVTASTFVTAWRRIDRMPPEPYTRSWLYRVVWRTLANQRRAGDRQARLLERLERLQADPELAGEIDADRDGLLLEALGRLRQQDQEVLRLVAWEELSYGEAATVLGCTPNAFAVRLYRARGALKHELDAVFASRTAGSGPGHAGRPSALPERRSSRAGSRRNR
jgi:RNA polymerase sigma-70 factor (ECF subfamily)